MNAEELLRRYLEQRRETGERELVLDTLSVEQVMQIIGVAPASRGPADTVTPRPVTSVPAEPPRQPAVPPAQDLDSREGTAPPVPRTSPPPSVGGVGSAADKPDDGDSDASALGHLAPGGSTSVPGAPVGLVVGAAARELFGGPIGEAESLDDIARLVRDCTRCPLYATATHGVPGEGSAQARLMCVGEAPGANEDATGRPFVGQAGQLLTKILAAINLTRDEVFIANVLKHRPPGNRNPRPEEVDACRPYLVRQIELIRPEVIVAFGTFAAQTLLETKLPIGKLRGAIHRYHGVPLIVTYHPAALLRNPAWKRPTWEDVQLARRLLDRAAT